MSPAPSLEWDARGELTWLTDSRLERGAGVRLAFTSRLGGVSPDPYASLNLAFHAGDAPENVRVNRGRICEALELDPKRLTCAQQVHGTSVAVIERALIGRGADSYDTAISETDAMATAELGAPLAMFFADCVPVVLVDPKRRAVGVAHAGWKGVAGNVVAALLGRMAAVYSSRAEDLLAYVGPAIGPCCYDVDEERAAVFARIYPGVASGGDRSLNLPGFVKKSLDDAGVPRQNIAAAGLCTADTTQTFYSYRGEGGVTGRHAAIVSIVP